MYLSRRELIGAAAMAGLGLAELDRLPPSQVRALRDAVRGRVLTPGADGYDAARVVFNRRYDGVQPPAVVRVRDPPTCGRRPLGGAVRRPAGGAVRRPRVQRRVHEPRAVVVDLRRLDGSRCATASPRSVRARATSTSTPRSPGAAPRSRRARARRSGSAGWPPAAGWGSRARALGLTIDRVRSFDVVTADGRQHRVDATTDEDLFWALRGGGGSFGDRHRDAAARAPGAPRGVVPRHALRRRRAPRRSAAWDDLAPGAPDELTAILTLTGAGATAFGQHLGIRERGCAGSSRRWRACRARA